MGRPKKQVDIEIVKKLAARLNSTRTIASILGVGENLLRRRFSAIIEQSRHDGHSKLIDLMWEMLEEKNQYGYKNPSMLMWAIERFIPAETDAEAPKGKRRWLALWGGTSEPQDDK